MKILSPFLLGHPVSSKTIEINQLILLILNTTKSLPEHGVLKCRHALFMKINEKLLEVQQDFCDVTINRYTNKLSEVLILIMIKVIPIGI